MYSASYNLMIYTIVGGVILFFIVFFIERIYLSFKSHFEFVEICKNYKDEELNLKELPRKELIYNLVSSIENLTSLNLLQITEKNTTLLENLKLTLKDAVENKLTDFQITKTTEILLKLNNFMQEEF